MSDAKNLKCEPCHISSQPLADSAIESHLAKLNGWQLSEVNGIKQINKSFKFKNFLQAMAFSNLIADMAEEQGHHPTITSEWGRVTLCWWTHSSKGLELNDFICAAKSDVLYSDV